VHGRRRVVCLVAATVLAAVSGCGSTAARQPSLIAGGTSATGGDGLGGPPNSAIPGSDLVSAGQSGNATGGPSRTAGAAALVPGAQAPGPDGRTLGDQAPNSAPVTSRGVTATTVTVGIAYQANLDAANRALGGNKVTSGNQVDEAKILVRAINSL
jgi:hypothetical protein